MKIRNVSDRTRVIAATGDVVEPDAVVNVKADIGRRLTKQTDVWVEPTDEKDEKR